MIAKWQNISYLRILCYIFLPTFYFIYHLNYSSSPTARSQHWWSNLHNISPPFTTLWKRVLWVISLHSLSRPPHPHIYFAHYLRLHFCLFYLYLFFYLHDGIFFCFSDIIDYTFLLFFHSMNISWAFLSLIYVVFFILYFIYSAVCLNIQQTIPNSPHFFFFFIKHIFPSFFLL